MFDYVLQISEFSFNIPVADTHVHAFVSFWIVVFFFAVVCRVHSRVPHRLPSPNSPCCKGMTRMGFTFCRQLPDTHGQSSYTRLRSMSACLCVGVCLCVAERVWTPVFHGCSVSFGFVLNMDALFFYDIGSSLATRLSLLLLLSVGDTTSTFVPLLSFIMNTVPATCWRNLAQYSDGSTVYALSFVNRSFWCQEDVANAHSLAAALVQASLDSWRQDFLLRRSLNTVAFGSSCILGGPICWRFYPVIILQIL